MAEQTANNLDAFLKIWAVIGPLIAAVASTMWSRHIQTSDREFELVRDKDREVKERYARDQEYERQIRMQKHDEVKVALADFMASSHEYVRKQSEYLTNPLLDRHQSATAANDKFVYSHQIVTLLGNDALVGKALEFWNATLTIPKSYNTPLTDDYEEKLRVYRSSRAEFNDVARSYLAELEGNPKQPTSE